MASSIFLYNSLSIRRLSDSFRGMFFMHISLAFITIFMIFFYISSTSKILIQTQHIEHRTPLYIKQSLGSPTNPPLTNLSMKLISFHKPFGAKSSFSDVLKAAEEGGETPPFTRDGGEGAKRRWSTGVRHDQMSLNAEEGGETPPSTGDGGEGAKRRWSTGVRNDHMSLNGEDENEVFHDREMFVENYKRMNRSLKIYVYPHKRDDPFANILLPVNYEPGGNYASESYFKKVLFKSHFITKDPSEAHLFYLPFSIASMRHDKRVGVGGIQNFIRDYIFNISHSYPYWNRTGGADHFYVACHSIGKVAMEKAVEVKINAIQMVCTSNYFIQGYVPHKDASLPQIWPRRGDPPNVAPSKRKKLAFFAGAMNSPVRQYVLKVWRNDSQIFVNNGRLKTPYDRELLRSKFCLHVKGFEVNTARIGDALYYGCVPVILADHYDLPFADILNWKSFSLIVTTADIPLLKKVLQGISSDEYQRLQSNVLKVRTHFQWYVSPVEYDAFYMVMYELWLRRSHVRISF